MKRVYEIMLEHLLWNIRFNAYKKVYNKNMEVVDGLSREDQQKLMFIYNEYTRIKTERILANPTVKKLMLDNYISHVSA
jgi:hypothetical protein